MSKYIIDERGNLIIEDAKIKRYTNFKGEEKINRDTGRVVNEKGSRNFCVYIDDEKLVEDLLAAGWVVKRSRVEEDGDVRRAYLPVAVRYGRIAPTIRSVVGGRINDLTEETVGMLDRASIITADLVIRPREWEPGRIKAYLRTGYFNLQKEYFEDKYFHDDDMPFDV